MTHRDDLYCALSIATRHLVTAHHRYTALIAAPCWTPDSEETGAAALMLDAAIEALVVAYERVHGVVAVEPAQLVTSGEAS